MMTAASLKNLWVIRMGGIAFLLIAMMSYFSVRYIDGFHNKLEEIVDQQLEIRSLFEEQMRIVQGRSILIRDILSTDDPFLKDDHIIEHSLLASRFVLILEKLQELPLSEKELELLSLQIGAARESYFSQAALIEKSREETRTEHYQELSETVAPLLDRVYGNFVEYRVVMEEKTRLTIAVASADYKKGCYIVISIYVLSLCLVVAVLMTFFRVQKQTEVKQT